MKLRFRKSRILPLGIALALLSGACAIPTDSAATPITSVPYDLLTSDSTTIPPAPAPDDALFSLTLVWAFGDGRNSIQPLERPVDSPPSVLTAMEGLLAGLNETERLDNPGLTTFVLESLSPVLAAPPVDDGILTISIAEQSALTESPNSLVIVAQLACTFLHLDSVRGVVLQDFEGERVPLTGFNSVTIEGAARASDFNDCQPPEDLTIPPEETELDQDGNPIETEPEEEA